MGTSEVWYLIACEEDDSLSIVDNDAVVNYELVNENDMVTFFYNRKTHIGKVLKKSADREVIDAEAKKRGVKPKRRKSSSKPQQEPKRPVIPPKRFLPGASSTPEKRPKRATKSEVKNMKSKAEVAINKEVMEEAGKCMGTQDPSNAEDQESASESSDEDLLSMIKDKVDKKKERNIILEKIQYHTSSATMKKNNDNQPRSSTSISPSKEQLKEMLIAAEAKLLMYEDDYKAPQEQNQNDVQTLKLSHIVKSAPKIFLDTVDVAENEFNNDYQPSWEEKKRNSTTSDLHNPIDSNASNNEVSIDVEKSGECEDQLYGKQHTETMVLLGDETYCTKKVLDDALRNSSKATHLVRRLIPGVFRKEAIINSTLTGQKPRAAGKTNYNGEIKGLSPKAVNAIIDFAKKIGKVRSWSDRSDFEKLRHAMSQKIGEVTRGVKPNTNTK